MEISYDQVVEVMTSTPMLIAIIIAWAIPLIIYLIIGFVRGARTSSGKVLSKPMIANVNYWIPFVIWFLLYPLLYLGLVMFPLWLKVLGN